MIEDELQGADQLLRELHSLERAIHTRIAVKANRAGASLYRKSLKRQLKRKAGDDRLTTWKTDVEGKLGEAEEVHLHERIAIRKQRGRMFRAEHKVGYVGLAKAYGHVFEFGSKNQVGNRIWTKTLRRSARIIFEHEKRFLGRELAKEARKSVYLRWGRA